MAKVNQFKIDKYLEPVGLIFLLIIITVILSQHILHCFRDETEFEGQKVAIYKRVQILIADIWACFEGQGYGEFHDIDTITMFADYRVPQALLYFGALEYSDELVEYLRKPHLFKSGTCIS